MKGKEKPFTPAMWIILVVLLAICWVVIRPMFVREGKCREGQTETVSNAKQIGIALYEFESAFGTYPDETTAAKIRQKSGDRFNLGNSSSNDYFRQLIAVDIVSSETLFYAKAGYTKKPDNVIDPADMALAPGEVGFGYLMIGKTALNSDGNLARTLVCAPLAFDGKTVSDQKFDPTVKNGYAVILRMDNSVQSMPIDPTTRRVMLGVGGQKHLLETGSDTVWGDSAKPVIVPPLPKP